MNLNDRSSIRRRAVADLVGDEDEDLPVKNKGGRPRKHPPKDPSLPKRGPGRPRKDDAPVEPAPKASRKPSPDGARKPAAAPEDDPLLDEDEDVPESVTLTSREVSSIQLYGISVQQLARMFKITRHLAEVKLRNCRPMDLGAHGNPLYDLAEAAAYLIEPKIDIDEYLSNVKSDRLPEHLREGIWNARLKQQRFEVNAGDLWRTSKVMEVVGELLLDFAGKLSQIPEQAERIGGLNADQYKKLRAIVDSVREEMADEAERIGRGERVTNQLGEDQEELD